MVSLASAAPTYTGFIDQRPVDIQGYHGAAMEPCISPDGRYLLFNNSNQARHTVLLYASRNGDGTFTYQGPIAGVNASTGLTAVASLAQDGELYFISTRSYSSTLSTVYAGAFASGAVTGVHLVPGVSEHTPGVVEFDVDASEDDRALFVSIGQFGAGGTGPTSASIALFDRAVHGFVPDPRSQSLLRFVNKPGTLTYAADISPSGLQLFYTQVTFGQGPPAIYRAERNNVAQPFRHVQRVAAATGFVEAPSVSSDGDTLYFHRKVDGVFRIFSATIR